MPAQQLVESFLHHFIKPAQQLHRELFQLRFRLPHGFRLRRRLCGRSCTAGHSFFGRFRRRGLHRHFRTGRRPGGLLLCLFGTGHGHLQLLPGLLTGRFEVGIFPPQRCVLCGGFFAAGLLPPGSAEAFFLAFSIPAGLGTAFLYPSIQSCAQKWYADRKGLATGVIGGAVGLSGAFLTVFVRTAVRGFWVVQGIRGAFWALGVVTLPVCLVGSLLLQAPPQTGQTQKPQENGKNTIDLAPQQMLRTKQYWLCAGAVCFSTPAVLLFSPIILKLGMERGLEEQAALWSVVLGSVGSAAGRLLMPLLSDRIGRRPTDMLLFAVSAGLSAGFAFAQGWGVVACYAGLTFCYSALAAVLPALSTDLFGFPHAGVNYGFLALGQSVGSLAFPFAANFFGLEAGRHWMAVAAAGAGFACIRALRPVEPSAGRGQQGMDRTC